MNQVLGVQLSDQQSRFQDMYLTSLPIVYGFLSLRVGGNRALAEDLTADTFAAAIRHYRAGRSDEVTISWLRTVARRRLVDHWRRRAVV
jgi:RNA polymerase sigma-70 factor (ECF subfamily)